jgi:hypothetical protein
MNRRDFVTSGLMAGALGNSAWAAPGASAPHFHELRTYHLRNDMEPTRIQAFFQEHFMPMMKRHGAGPVGCFNVVSGLSSPALLVLIDYRSLADMQRVMDRSAGDQAYMKAWKDFEAASELPYVRYESELLKAFSGHPQVQIPPTESSRPPRIFELRIYESKDAVALSNKIDMFNQEEIKIFSDCGFANIFFGEAICGTRLPHLTYMIGFDNMAAREKAWDLFRVNPDWERIKGKPGWTDKEAVSNIHASFLRPTRLSDIR